MERKNRVVALLLALILLLNSTVYVSAEESTVETEAPAVRVQEVATLRETNSETYLLSDGSYECVVYAEDKYYRDNNGTLQLIDNSIIRNHSTSQTNKEYKNAANAFDVLFSSSGNPQISISSGGTSLTFSPIMSTGNEHISADTTATLMSIGQVENCATLDMLTYTGDNTVSYANVYTSTDLVYILENGALKEYIILDSNNAPNEFAFTFDLNGLTWQAIDNTHCFVNEAGETVFSLASLFAIDADGVLTEDVSYEITPVPKSNKVIVNVVLNEEYLSNTERAFPVVIDPTILISGSNDTFDSYVSSRYPSTNYYLNSYLRTGKDTDFYIRRSYIRFDLPYAIDPDSISSAYIGLKVYSGATPSLTAYRVTGNWTPSTLTWNNKPSHSTTDISSTATLSTDNWYRLYVTSIVKKWLNLTVLNYGFMLKDATETDSAQWTTFYSSDSSYPNRPELVIYYTAKRPAVSYDLVLYKNADMTNDVTELNNYISVASTVFEETYNVHFNRLWSASSTALNQRSGCTKADSAICDSSCGANLNCTNVHHKAAYYFLYVNGSSSSKVFRYVDYAICRTKNGEHDDIYGATATNGVDIIVSLYAPNIQRTTCHEMSHWLGADDFVCVSGQPCVMTYGSNVYNIWCTQCAKDIVNFLG